MSIGAQLCDVAEALHSFLIIRETDLLQAHLDKSDLHASQASNDAETRHQRGTQAVPQQLTDMGGS